MIQCLFLTAVGKIENDREVCPGDERLKKRDLAAAVGRARRLLIIILFMAPGLGPRAMAQASGILMGRVFGPDAAPVGGAQVRLLADDGLVQLEAVSAADGSFAFAGIPVGSYGLLISHPGLAQASQRGILLEPFRVLLVRIIMAAGMPAADSGASFVWIDLSDVSARTVIDDFQVQSMPSADNIWSLIENQEFSATTNRIDVGGVWASLPALWSSRGGVSWTQSSYLINGLEADDPYSTGTPLYYPDLEAVRFVSHGNGRQPIAHLSPGGAFDLVPKQGTADYHGGLSASISSPGMSSDSVPPRLESEGLFERTRLNSFQNYSAHFSGPILPRKVLVFASLSRLSLNRDVAGFGWDDKGTVSSALVNLTFRLGRSSVNVLWTGQAVHHPTLGAGRDVPFSATLDRKNLYNVFQVIWRGQLRADHSFEIGAAFNSGNFHSRFQEGSAEPHGREVFSLVPSGAADSAGRADRATLALQGKGQALWGRLSGHHHQLDYGFSWRYAASSAEEEVLQDIHLHYLSDEPLEIVRFNTPARRRERSFDVHLYAEDRILFPNLASISFGLHLVSTRGRVPQAGTEGEALQPTQQGGKIDWLNVAPRLGFAFPFLADKSLTLRVSAGRYYFQLPLEYLTFGNPQALGGLVYRWRDRNRDSRYQPGEEGELWRREGPFYADIDAELKRPYADEYAVSLTKVFNGDLYLTLAGFYRETRQLAETLNIGVPLTAYSPVQIYDPGDDTVVGTPDDLDLTVYDQDPETLGNDFFLLTNPDGGSRVSRYRGLDLTLVKKYGRAVLFLAATATEAVGASSPGNTEYENDDGVIGSLYDSPNGFLFVKGRLRFDRAYTARLGLSFPLPSGFRLSCLAKYYDGQPFSRKITVTGLNQGPFYVQAFPRGVARYEFNMTVDLRLEKSVALGMARVRLFADAYNIFNWALATEENEWTGPQFPLRYATEVQSPRVFRLGIRYEF
jgi:hypothetical protein